MISRRGVLLGGLSGVVGAISGCQGLPGSNLQEAREHIQSAHEDFDAAREEYTSQTETMFDTEQEVTFDPDPIFAAVDSARDEISQAEGLAGESLEEEISTYRTYAGYVEQVALGLEDLSSVLNYLYEASSYMESVRMSDANGALLEGLDDLDLASDHHSQMDQLLSNIDPSNLEDEDVGYTRMESALEEIGNYITGLEHFLRGYEYYTEGYNSLLEAAERYDSREYSSAESEFRSASSTFEDAMNRFREGENNSPQSMLQNFITSECLASNARDAADLYVEAAQFTQDGNVDNANQRVSEAESTLNQRC